MSYHVWMDWENYEEFVDSDLFEKSMKHDETLDSYFEGSMIQPIVSFENRDDALLAKLRYGRSSC